MYIMVERINVPDEHNNYILANVRYLNFTGRESEDVEVSVKLPPTDLPLSEIRKNALTNAKRILSELLKQLET